MVIGLLCRNLHALAFRPAQGGQVATEDAAGIHADDIVTLAHIRLGYMAVDDRRLAGIIASPVEADRQTMRITFTRHLAKHGKGPNAF